MFRFDMHILKSHSHTRTHALQERNLHDWHQEKKREEITEDKCQRSHTKYH